MSRLSRPTHKVLATLGAMEPQMIENLRTALQSGRHGKPVVLCEQEQAIRRVPILPEANLAYLDVMALLDTWNQWELLHLLRRVLERDQDEANAQDVLAALTIHRGVAPGSKLILSRCIEDTFLCFRIYVAFYRTFESRISIGEITNSL